MRQENITQQYVNKLSYEIVGAAIDVHKEMGPGLLESIYEECLFKELKNRKIQVERQKPIQIFYKGSEVRRPLVIDLLVEDLVVVELKSKDELQPIDEAQILSYLRLARKPKGLLINFNVTNITSHGLKPFVNDHFANLPKD